LSVRADTDGTADWAVTSAQFPARPVSVPSIEGPPGGTTKVRYEVTVSTDLVGRARAGDENAFRELIEPYRRELHVHCYRILGSVQDAEDALQETLLSAWQGLPGFESRASVRTWLYRVATSRCLNALRSARRRPPMNWPPPGVAVPEPTRLGPVMWLDPYPDALLAGLSDTAPGPEARYEAREAISVAFVTALQLLPPRQRAVLILRDVLGFSASETSRMLESTQESVTSALKRARATVQRELPSAGEQDPPPPPGSAREQELVDRFARAYQAGEVAEVVALLTDGAWLIMPPVPIEYQGRDQAFRFLSATGLRPGHDSRLIPTRANGQPAFAIYVHDSGDSVSRPAGILVLTLAGDAVSVMTGFIDDGVLPFFGLPPAMPR
jgi:RNA polymerase sigma-70 factor (TIGR02960 family)